MSSRSLVTGVTGAFLLATLTACDDPTPVPDPAVLEVEVTTAGAAADLDSDGYSVQLDSESPRSITPNATVVFDHLEPGEHTVLVSGVEANCDHTGANPQVVTVERGQTTTVAFALACVPRRGDLQVAITTTGPSHDEDGYVLEVFDGASELAFSERVPVDFEVTLEDIPGGDGQVVLSDVASNCSVGGSNPRAAPIPHGQTLAIGFDISCVAPLDLDFSVTTSGTHPQPDGYTINVRRIEEWWSIAAPQDGSVRLEGLAPGTYTVMLLHADPSCDTADNPRTVRAPEGGLVPVSLEVVCAEPREFAFVNVADGDSEIYLARDDGTGLTRLTDNSRTDTDPAWSPAGDRLAFTSDRDGGADIYVMDADGTGVVRLTEEPAADRHPAWSPVAERILFVSERDGNPEIYAMAPDGTGVTRLTTYDGADGEPAWSPDGARIAFTRDGLLHVMDADGSNVRALTEYYYYYYYYYYRVDGAPAWSPDGTRIAVSVTWCYDSSCQRPQIYEVDADGSGEEPLVLGADFAATDPAWYPDGLKIAFTVEECPALGGSCTRGVRLLRPGIEVLELVEELASAPAWRP